MTPSCALAAAASSREDEGAYAAAPAQNRADDAGSGAASDSSHGQGYQRDGVSVNQDGYVEDDGGYSGGYTEGADAAAAAAGYQGSYVGDEAGYVVF